MSEELTQETADRIQDVLKVWQFDEKAVNFKPMVVKPLAKPESVTRVYKKRKLENRSKEIVLSQEEFIDDYDLESAITLWHAVIQKALYDATLGLSDRIINDKKIKFINPWVTDSGPLSKQDVYSARYFISNKNSGLQDICISLALDYQETKNILIEYYNKCVPYMPEEWKEVLE